MVHMPRLNSRVVSSTLGSPSSASEMLRKKRSAQPNLCANLDMMVWSGRLSNEGATTRSRHWSDRFDAVTEP